MKPKKLSKIQSTVSQVFSEILGENVELRFRSDGLTVDVQYCSRVGCDGCDLHVFGVGGLGDPKLRDHLPPVVYENVAKAVLACPPRRLIGFAR